MAGPGDEIAAGAGGRGHLRVSHADREQVIGTLKAAFVQGMLAKDEFDLRVGQTLAARTYADLAALTADLPAGLAAAKPPQPARAEGELPVLRPGRWIAVATAAYAGAWVYAPLSPRGGDNQTAGALIFGGGFVYLIMLAVCVAIMVYLRREKRAGGQSPRRPAPGVSRQASRRLPSPGPGGQLPSAGPGQQQSAEAAPIRGPRRARLPGWRPQATTGYLTHPA
jgi:DUF1707 SHOCT-like domain